MNWLLIALIAQFVNGTSAVFDRLLLKKSYSNPVGYTFWIGILSLLFLLAIPWGFHPLPTNYVVLSIIIGFAFVAAMFFYFKALYLGQASSIVVFIGAAFPVFSLVFSWLFLGLNLEFYQLLSFVLLVLAAIMLFFSEEAHLRKPAFLAAIVGALFLSLTSVLTKMLLGQTDVINSLIWTKFGTGAAALLFLVVPAWRKKIIRPEEHHKSKHPLLYLANRAYAGLASLLIVVALSLGIPPLVDATHNIQFIFVALGGWLLLKEHFRGRVLLFKLGAIVLIFVAVLWLSAGDYVAGNRPDPDRAIKWGVTFSQKFSQDMSLDWRDNYNAILNDLGVKHIRLVAYWDLLEPERGKYKFEDLDYQMNLAEQKDVQVVLAIGQKVPRWPECHFPSWSRDISVADRNAALFEYLSAVVDRYEGYSNLKYWQVENEPFLNFGECPELDEKLLDGEIELVRSLDSRPILMTDSGEVGFWFKAFRRGDIFGTTMYRRVHHDVFGNIEYHLPASAYFIKDKIVRSILSEGDKRTIVTELAAEAWLKRQLYTTSIEDQFRVFDLPYFKDTIKYAKDSGFDEHYLWGVEWWYWLKERHNHPEFWDYARSILKTSI